MKTDYITTNGEHLGYCPIKGNLYSISIGNNKYQIWAVINGQSFFLIDYIVNK